MHQKSKKEIKCFSSDEKQNNNFVPSSLPSQKVFSISSTSFNFPSKKPCMLNCSHHPHSHHKHQPPLPPRQKEYNKDIDTSTSDDIEKKIKIVRDISQRKSEICLNEHQRTIPSLNKLNDFYEKELNTKNEYSSIKYLENCQCQNKGDANQKIKQNNLKFNISDFDIPLYHLKPNKTFPCQRSMKLDLEKPNHLWRENILFNEPDIDYLTNCDMFKVIDKLKLKLSRFLKKKLLLICVIAILFFLIGLAIQFYTKCETNSREKTKSDYERLRGMNTLYVKKASEKDAKDVLNDLFISVKTTQKYHYPRVIVQLETWASLVKEQVMYLNAETCSPNCFWSSIIVQNNEFIFLLITDVVFF